MCKALQGLKGGGNTYYSGDGCEDQERYVNRPMPYVSFISSSTFYHENFQTYS